MSYETHNTDHETLLTCYQHPDEESLLAVTSEPRKLKERVTRT